ncbi:MAG: 30S ribosomal protein S18 [Bilifractor sp.]|jgi:small subunit ribosomal protein S18|nr:30S ribosomal protein S18 [Lachnospiraceae bacterium]
MAETNANTEAVTETSAAPARTEERPARSEAPRRKPQRRRRKVCVFCGKDAVIDYKDTATLRKYISERGKILPRRVTANCAKHQREMTSAIKRARHLAMLPYVED